jgi:aspartyl/asparaginyl beta-hydroxylase (cupin superfamily)
MDPGVKHYYKEGQGIMFDDTFPHDVINDSDEIRVILFLDIARNMPWYLDGLNQLILNIAARGTHLKKMRENAAKVGQDASLKRD